MSCANNFQKKDKHYSNITYKIPCRWCINCREDRRKEWMERCKYEFKTKISGTFLTLTYDETFLIQECMREGNDGLWRASLNYKNVKNFIKSLRKYINENQKIQNVLCNPNFTYLGVGEYGENGKIVNRPHWHILFFGLDFKYCENIYKKEWKYGLIESDPILKGGINYVLKYMDKQIMGKEARWENYYRYNLEPPKQFQSKGIGQKLYENNIEKARKNNGKIPNGMKDINIPNYYRNKYKIYAPENYTTEKEIDNLKNYHKKLKRPKEALNENEYRLRKLLIQEEQQKLAKIRELNAIERARKNGEKTYIIRSDQ